MNLFDIIGPIMIGPSSSHTAGAARIGLITRRLLDDIPSYAKIDLFGSFGKTYKGHGTDRALVGGLLNMQVDDDRLRDSLSMAIKSNLKVDFNPIDEQLSHPNTVIITAIGKSGKKVKVLGVSLGGGSIRIESLNDMEVAFTGNEHTLIIQHLDTKGVIAKVSSLIADNKINIATMRVFRQEIGKKAIMVIEVDSAPSVRLLNSLKNISSINTLTFLEKGKLT